MIIALTGFMASGKSCVGRELSLIRGARFIDLDFEVERRCSMKIPQIFSRGGEALFRREELSALKEVVACARDASIGGEIVLALGGGTLTQEEACAALEGVTRVYLRTSLETISERLCKAGQTAARPVLTSCDAGVLLSQRNPVYEACADYVIDTDGFTPRQVAERIDAMLREQDELSAARNEINEIDAAMAALFERRMNASRRIARYKKEKGLPVMDPVRESENIRRNSAYISDKELLASYTRFEQSLMDISKNYQNNLISAPEAPELLRDKRVLIVGLGLIGGSYADALSRLGIEVGAIARRQETLDYALRKGIVSSGMTSVDADYVSGFDLVVSALYPGAFIEWMREYHPFIKNGAVITDVTGVKLGVVGEVQSLLIRERPDVEFIPSHPMAGREVCGVENSDASIFRGANFIITPTACNSSRGIDVIRELGRLLCFKNIAVLSPQEHDEMIGFLSQLTHCIAVSLMNCNDSRHLCEYSGDSFRDLTRIARINEDMWTELFLFNRDELLRQMDIFMEQFSSLRRALDCRDTERMKEMMRISTLRRSYFDK